MSSDTHAELISPVTAQQLVQDTLNLVAMPAVYMRLQEVMSSEDASMADVADVVSLDPALAARLLRVANSAYYGLPSQVDTITRAANILGTQQIHDLVLATSVAHAFDDLSNDLMEMNTFWYRSVQCGYFARDLARAAGMRNGESLFVRGLLHDIGHLMLFNHFPEQCRQALAESADSLVALYRQERSLIGCDANEVGAELMRSWKLPASFVDSLVHLCNPQQAGEIAREVAVLHIAAWFSHGVDTDLLLSDVCGRIDPSVWELAGLEPGDAERVFLEVSEDIVEAMYLLFSDGD